MAKRGKRLANTLEAIAEVLKATAQALRKVWDEDDEEKLQEPQIPTDGPEGGEAVDHEEDIDEAGE